MMSAPEKKKQSAPRTRRRLNGMSEKAGVAKAPAGSLSPTLAMLNAALRVWEAKQNRGRVFSVWRRNSSPAAHEPAPSSPAN